MCYDIKEASNAKEQSLNVYCFVCKFFKVSYFVSLSGDVLIKNETIESKLISFRRQNLHRLEYKIQNDDNLLSFAQIDIIDTDVGRRRMEIYFSRY